MVDVGVPAWRGHNAGLAPDNNPIVNQNAYNDFMSAVKAVMGNTAYGDEYRSYGSHGTTGAVARPKHLDVRARETTIFIYALAGATNEALLRYVAIVPIQPGQKHVIDREVYYRASMFDESTEFVPGTGMTQTMHEHKTEIKRWIKAIEMSYDLFKQAPGTQEYNRKMFQLTLAYNATLQYQILEAMRRAPRLFANRKKVMHGVVTKSLRDQITTARDLFGCLTKGETGLGTIMNTVKSVSEERNNAVFDTLVTQSSFVNGVSMLKRYGYRPERGVVQSKEVASYVDTAGADSLPMLRLQPTVRPNGDILENANEGKCLFITHHIVGWPSNRNDAKEQGMTRYLQVFDRQGPGSFHTFGEDELAANVCFDLTSEANDNAVKQTGRAPVLNNRDVSYIVFRLNTVKTHTPTALGSGALELNLGELLTASAYGLQQNKVTTQAWFYGACAVRDPNRVLPLDHAQALKLESGGGITFVSRQQLMGAGYRLSMIKGDLIVVRLNRGDIRGWEGKTGIMSFIGRWVGSWAANHTDTHFGYRNHNLNPIYREFVSKVSQGDEVWGKSSGTSTGFAATIPQVSFQEWQTVHYMVGENQVWEDTREGESPYPSNTYPKCMLDWFQLPGGSAYVRPSPPVQQIKQVGIFGARVFN